MPSAWPIPGRAGLYDGGTLVCVTARPACEDANGLGLIARGPDRSKLIGQVSDLLRRWSQERPEQPVVTGYPAATPDDRLAAGAHVNRRVTRLTIGW